MHKIRLMCSKERQEVEALKNRLSGAGVRSEIRTNRLASDLGITRLEIFVDELDLPTALKVRQDFKNWVGADASAGSPRGNGRIPDPGFVVGGRPDLVTEVEVLPSPSNEPLLEESPSRAPEAAGTEPESEFAAATALLEKEVEELLVRESKLIDRCSAFSPAPTTTTTASPFGFRDTPRCGMRMAFSSIPSSTMVRTNIPGSNNCLGLGNTARRVTEPVL